MKYNLKHFSYYTLIPILYLTFFLSASTAQTAEPISMHNGSNDAVCSKEVPFGGRIDTKLHLGVKIPRKPQILEPECQISNQINTLKFLTFERSETDEKFQRTA